MIGASKAIRNVTLFQSSPDLVVERYEGDFIDGAAVTGFNPRPTW